MRYYTRAPSILQDVHVGQTFLSDIYQSGRSIDWKWQTRMSAPHGRNPITRPANDWDDQSRSMTQILAKYWTVFTIGVSERFTYRTDFFVGTLMRFLPIVTTI